MQCFKLVVFELACMLSNRTRHSATARRRAVDTPFYSEGVFSTRSVLVFEKRAQLKSGGFFLRTPIVLAKEHLRKVFQPAPAIFPIASIRCRQRHASMQCLISRKGSSSSQGVRRPNCLGGT
jgi:hypothetical protein